MGEFPGRSGRLPLLQEVLQQRPQLLPKALAPHGQGEVRPEVAGHGARVVVVAVKLEGNDRMRAQRALDRIGELDLRASPRLSAGQPCDERRGKDIAADDGEVGWLGPELRLLDGVSDPVEAPLATVCGYHAI